MEKETMRDPMTKDGTAISRNLCDSCINNRCIFQYGIVRNRCDFYKGMDTIIELPPAESERKHGKWIFSPGHVEGACTLCNFKIYGRPYNNTYLIVPYNYCPNCGAKMDGGKE